MDQYDLHISDSMDWGHRAFYEAFCSVSFVAWRVDILLLFGEVLSVFVRPMKLFAHGLTKLGTSKMK